MIKASALPSKYEIGKTRFYERRNYLLKLGYQVEPNKQGRNSFYTREQVQLFDELDAHIKAVGEMEGFRTPVIDNGNEGENGQGKVEPVRNGGELVRSERELVPNDSANLSAEEEEIYIETDPLEDIKEQNLRSVDAAAQHFAAQNLAALNYLTVDYMKHRQFSIGGLSEQVQKSEQAVKQSFLSVMESPEATTKKLLKQIRQRRSK
jgi:hypothetical protein